MSKDDLMAKEMGKRIYECRKNLGLTQEALAEISDVTPQFVSYAESGKRAMRPENLLKISKALGVSADYILTGEVLQKDIMLMSNKFAKLTPAQFKIVEKIVDECIKLTES